jgi:hypothetical protein
VTKVISSGIVEVDFDVQQQIPNGTLTFPGSVRMAVTTSEYERVPMQVGDKGVAVPADAYLGGVTGLGGGTADLTRRANLTALVFQPLGNTAWFSVDMNAYVLYGPNGVVLMDAKKKTVFTLTPSGIKITLQAGTSVEIDGNCKITGTLEVDGNTTVNNINIQGTETGGGPT